MVEVVNMVVKHHSARVEWVDPASENESLGLRYDGMEWNGGMETKWVVSYTMGGCSSGCNVENRSLRQKWAKSSFAPSHASYNNDDYDNNEDSDDNDIKIFHHLVSSNYLVTGEILQ